MKKRIMSFLIIMALVFTQLSPLADNIHVSAQVDQPQNQTSDSKDVMEDVANSVQPTDDIGNLDVANPFENMDKIRARGVKFSTEAYQGKVKSEIKDYNEQTHSEKEIFNNDKNCYIIRFRDDVALSDIYDCIRTMNYKLLAGSKQRMFKIEIGDIKAFRDKYSSLVKYIEKPTSLKLSDVTPNDSEYSSQWALPDMNLPSAWDITKGSNNVKVAIIDSGLYRNHEDLQGSNFLTGYDVCQNKAGVTSDEEGHGTMVASVIGATTNNRKGVAGACWNITIVPYKVMDRYGDISSDDVITAIMMAADDGCDVINMSLGGYEIDKATQDAINYAYNKGCIVVAAAGNEGDSDDPDSGKYSYPASCNHVISAAAINSSNSASSFSQHNNLVDVSAPGENVLVASANGASVYSKASGTSFSSPYVASVAALARSLDDGINQDFFEKFIKETSTDLGDSSYDNYYGWGLINAKKIVQKAKYPSVIGVTENATYNGAKKIIFSSGKATLNGVAFVSGTTVSKNGTYTLIITNSVGKITTIHFTIDAPLVLKDIKNNASYNTDKSIVFNYGTATLNGKTIASGYVVKAEGKYTVVLTSPLGGKATYNFTIDKTKPVVTGVENGKTFSGKVTITFNEGTANLNGSKINSGYILATNGVFHLVVTDAAGNALTLDFTLINNESSITTVDSPQIKKWVYDDTYKYLFAISEDGQSILYINASTLKVDKTLKLAAPASDLISSEGKLYISINSKKQIYIADIATTAIVKTLSTTKDAYRMIKDGSVIYYIQGEQGCEVHSYNLTTDIDKKLNTGNIHNGEMAINPIQHLLYFGESGLSGCHLYYYNITEDKIIGTSTYDNGYGYSYPQRGLVYDGKYVFYAGRAFDPNNVTHVEGDYDSNKQVGHVYNGMVFTANSIYDEESHVKLGSFKTDTELISVSQDGRNLFVYNSGKLTRYTDTIKAIDKSSIIKLIGGTYPPKIPSTTTSKKTDDTERTLKMTSELTKWVYNGDTQMLYAISNNDKALFFINKKTLNIEKTIRLKSQPTDIIIDDGFLYVALDDANQILQIDIKTGKVTKQFYVKFDPYQIVKDGNYLFYAARDQGRDVSRYDVTTGIDEKLGIRTLSSPSLAVNHDKKILYIGESNSTSARLYYYDMEKNTVIGVTDDSSNLYNRTTIYDGTYVFYNGAVYDSNAPKLVESLGSSNIIFVKYGFIFTQNKIYSEDEFSLITELPQSSELIEVSNNYDLFLYSKKNQTIVKELGESPKVTGVEDGKGYINSVTITFDYGTALLDGKPFISGGKVTSAGDHKLIVSGDENNNTEVRFTIYNEQPGDNTPIKFADENLKQALLDMEVDANRDGEITQGEMRVETGELYLDEYDITNLSGLQYAINLTWLELSDNNISDLKPLSGLTKLTYLDLGMNKISDLSPLSPLDNLSTLYLNGNKITDIKVVSKMKKLEELDLSSNQITDISALAGLTNLNSLYLLKNKISSITSLGALTKLCYLDISSNTVVDITTLSKLTSLGMDEGVLNLSGNQITNISALSKLTKLTTLMLSGNPIAGINALGQLTKLDMLDISDCGLKELKGIDQLKNLSYLDGSKNHITDINPISKLTKLEFLDLSGNPIHDVTPIKTTGLYVLYLSNCGITNISSLKDLKGIKYLDLSKNSIVNISSLGTLENLVSINLSNNQLTDIEPLKEFEPFYLDLSYNYLDTSNASRTMEIINDFIDFSECEVIYTPQKDLSKAPKPVIKISDYVKTATNKNITVTATTDKGKLNATSHTFTQNGSYTFVATDNLGKSSSVTVKITNIDKKPPVITIKPYNTAPTYSKVVVYAAVNEGTLNASSHTFTKNGTFTFSATDSAGNKSQVTISIKNILEGYTINFNTQGGNTISSKKVALNAKISAPASPKRSGYVFEGWYTAANGGTKVVFPYKVKSNVTLYAHWKLGTPTALKGSKSTKTSVRLTWKGVSGVSGYEVYYGTSSSSVKKLASTITTNSYTKTGLAKRKTYYFKVRAYKVVGGKKLYSSYTKVVKVKL